jgi:hypothetical protein
VCVCVWGGGLRGKQKGGGQEGRAVNLVSETAAIQAGCWGYRGPESSGGYLLLSM